MQNLAEDDIDLERFLAQRIWGVSLGTGEVSNGAWLSRRKWNCDLTIYYILLGFLQILGFLKFGEFGKSNDPYDGPIMWTKTGVAQQPPPFQWCFRDVLHRSWTLRLSCVWSSQRPSSSSSSWSPVLRLVLSIRTCRNGTGMEHHPNLHQMSLRWLLYYAAGCGLDDSCSWAARSLRGKDLEHPGSQSESGWWFGTFFPIYWKCHHPNWRTHIFRGWSTTNQTSMNRWICVWQHVTSPPSVRSWRQEPSLPFSMLTATWQNQTPKILVVNTGAVPVDGFPEKAVSDGYPRLVDFDRWINHDRHG